MPLGETNDFHYRDLPEARQRKFNARTLRGIVLENATTTAIALRAQGRGEGVPVAVRMA